MLLPSGRRGNEVQLLPSLASVVLYLRGAVVELNVLMSGLWQNLRCRVRLVS